MVFISRVHGAPNVLETANFVWPKSAFVFTVESRAHRHIKASVSLVRVYTWLHLVRTYVFTDRWIRETLLTAAGGRPDGPPNAAKGSTGCSLHKSSSSSCTRARVCKQVSQCVLHTHHETGSYNVTVQEPAPVLHTQLSHQHTDRRLTKVNTKVPKKSVDGGHTMPPCPTWLGSVLPRACLRHANRQLTHRRHCLPLVATPATCSPRKLLRLQRFEAA